MFKLDMNHKIVILLNISFKELDYCYQDPVVFIQQSDEVILSDSTVHWDIQQLKKKLELCLTGKWQLDNSITEDIGYLYNEFYQDRFRFVIECIDDFETWVGYKYQVWQAHNDEKTFITWLYNDKDGNIIFEITPFYPFLYTDPEEEKNYVTYDVWIKGYKPYFTTIISRKIAQQWLEKANHIVQQIKDNIARWEAEEKAVK